MALVSLTIEGYDPQEVAAALDASFRIQVRAGLHCAPLVHRALGTFERGGTVRLSPGHFTTAEEIEAVLRGHGRTGRELTRAVVGPDRTVATGASAQEESAMSEKPWFEGRLAIRVHPMRRLLHRCAGLRVGQSRRDRRAGRAGRHWTWQSSNGATSVAWAFARAWSSTTTAIASFSTAKKRKLHRLRSPAAAMPQLALLGIERPHAQAWKQTCQVCPGSGKGKLVSGRADPASGEPDPHLAAPARLLHPCKLPSAFGGHQAVVCSGLGRFFRLAQVCRLGGRYHWSTDSRAGYVQRRCGSCAQGRQAVRHLSASCLTGDGYAAGRRVAASESLAVSSLKI